MARRPHFLHAKLVGVINKLVKDGAKELVSRDVAVAAAAMPDVRKMLEDNFTGFAITLMTPIVRGILGTNGKRESPVANGQPFLRGLETIRHPAFVSVPPAHDPDMDEDDDRMKFVLWVELTRAQLQRHIAMRRRHVSGQEQQIATLVYVDTLAEQQGGKLDDKLRDIFGTIDGADGDEDAA